MSSSSWSALGRFSLLASLYFSQGLPYGFFTQALPVWMRQQGLSLKAIGAASVLALPWAFKFLWAPIVDRYSHSPLGRRRGWILPLQLLTCVSLLALAVLGGGADGGIDDASGMSGADRLLWLMAVAMFVTNFFAATQDIATDGLAVDLLRPSERGVGNGIQVAAYRVGMIVGGGALLAGFAIAGWLPTMVAMALLVALMTIPIALYREPISLPPTPVLSGATSSSTATSSTGVNVGATGGTHRDDDEAPVSLLSAVAFLKRNQWGMLIWCAGLAAYKIGDAIGSPMARVMLVDLQYSTVDIAMLLGTGGSIAGMLGAMLGGFTARRHRLPALIVAGLLHAGLMASYALVPALDVPPVVAGVLIVLEHITGGMATVSLFTAMMDACAPRTGATDYTTQASVVVIASGIGSGLSGVSAELLGYVGHFLVAAVVCTLGTLVMLPLYRRGIAPSPQPPPPASTDLDPVSAVES